MKIVMRIISKNLLKKIIVIPMTLIFQVILKKLIDFKI